MYKLHLGNNKEVLKGFAENSIDSIVTDPPYELGFMGKSWDSTGIAYDVEMWKECLRVLKPGGYILAFSGTRTYHRMAVAIEDAGFEVRDMIEWVYGSGFPKSLNIGKAVDKLQGNNREVVEYKYQNRIPNGRSGIGLSGNNNTQIRTQDGDTKGTSEYEGWGTALKPAHEPICMARKPLAEKTVAENCLKWGTGGINIDESRVGTEEMKARPSGVSSRAYQSEETTTAGGMGEDKVGRFPANLILSDCEEVRECFPETGKGSDKPRNRNTLGSFGMPNDTTPEYADSGNASRFFKSIIYEAKASKAERNRGCEAVFNLFEQSEGLEEKEAKITGMQSDQGMKVRMENGIATGFKAPPKKATNHHPTVKPIALMEYLIKMVTPKGGVVLDPFNGSGSTGCAAVKNGFDYHGIDITKEYITISEKRIKAY